MLTNTLVAGGYASGGQPAGALFYWSEIRFGHDVDFGLFDHEGFEILWFILEGRTSHYDEVTGQWTDLDAGDVQIIRSGSGISHSEHAAAGARVFSIWFDPGYEAALQRQPSYTHHPAASFTTHRAGDAIVTDLIGSSGPVQARTEEVSVQRITVPAGSSAALELGCDRFTLAYLIDGSAAINGTRVGDGDVISLNWASSITVDATATTELFVVSVPASPPYQPVRQR